MTVQGEVRAVRAGGAAGLRDGPAQPAAPQGVLKPGVRTMLVPRPSTAVVGGTPIRDEGLLTWARQVVDTVIDPQGPRPAQGRGWKS